jgi:hypothetical protein
VEGLRRSVGEASGEGIHRGGELVVGIDVRDQTGVEGVPRRKTFGQ